MRSRFVAAGTAVVLSLLSSAPIYGAKAAGIVAWTNSQTENDKTIFQVKPGRAVTFSVKAENAAEYIWQVNGETRLQAKGASLKWVVPEKNGLWKIRAIATNTHQEQYVGDLLKDFKQFHKRDTPPTIKDSYYPPRCRKEWIISTFLKPVKPGESIARAIKAVPPEGGIVKLLPGRHDVSETIHINRSNVAVVGTKDSELRSTDPAKSVFSLNEKWEKRPHLENVTFKGFKITSSYDKHGRNSFVVANQVNNLTLEGLHNLSFIHSFMGINWARTSRGQLYYAKSTGLRMFNNTIRNSTISGICFSDSVVAYNHMSGKRPGSTCYGMYLEAGNNYVSIHHNYLENMGANGNIQTESHNAHIFENVCKGSQCGIWLRGGGPDNVRIENNIVTGTTVCGIGTCRQGTQRNLWIRNNRISNCRGYGIFFTGYGHSMKKGSTGGATIANNVIYNCGKGGIAVRLPENYRGKPVNFDVSDSLIVKNNIIANVKGCGIVPCKNKGTCSSSHNNFWNVAKGRYGRPCKSEGEISVDPLFASPSAGDFHLKSKTGRWDPKAKKWVKDNLTSPCIDAGDPKADCSDEPAPNGGKVNVGAYGNTTEASKSSAR
ncbi:MAG: right-handed parallel beta-helix repeat-containing protein [Phycisphaerae bacterium]|nr:right-handed parallel beta-helix repeat-containing protein [Phycisphaerae bacterium]